VRRSEARFRRFVESGVVRPREFQLVRKDGSLVSVLGGSAAIEDGEVLSFAIDLSEQKRAERAARERRRATSRPPRPNAGRPRRPTSYAAKKPGPRGQSRARAAPSAWRMSIDALLSLAQLTRTELRLAPVDLSALGGAVVEQLRTTEPARAVDVCIADGLEARGDARLLRIALENLLGNAWKFTRRRADARIELAGWPHPAIGPGALGPFPHEKAFVVVDNGVGFDMAFADKLFLPFQRLDTGDEFEGSGVGLAIVQRIVERHGGRIWAKSTNGPSSASPSARPTGPSKLTAEDCNLSVGASRFELLVVGAGPHNTPCFSRFRGEALRGRTGRRRGPRRALSAHTTMKRPLRQSERVRGPKTKSGCVARRADSRETVRAILEATELLLPMIGTRELRMATVALRAGVSKSTLWEYFPTRMHLLRALEERSWAIDLPNALRQIEVPEGASDLDAAVRHFAEVGVRFTLARARLHGTSLEVDAATSLARGVIVDQVVDAFVDEATRRGWLSASRRPDLRAALQLVTRIVPALAWHAPHDLAADDDTLVREVSDLVARYLVNPPPLEEGGRGGGE
jgi:AcrR family transcriptional regulator